MVYVKNSCSKVGFNLLDAVLNFDKINKSQQISKIKDVIINSNDIILYGYDIQFTNGSKIMYFTYSDKPDYFYVYDYKSENIKCIASLFEQS